MSDTIKGEVLVPASRFLPKCECAPRDPTMAAIPEPYGEGFATRLVAWCAVCEQYYEQELPQGVEGIPHGQV